MIYLVNTLCFIFDRSIASSTLTHNFSFQLKYLKTFLFISLTILTYFFDLSSESDVRMIGIIITVDRSSKKREHGFSFPK